METRQQFFLKDNKIKEYRYSRKEILANASGDLFIIASDKEFKGTILSEKAASLYKEIAKKLSEYDDCFTERIDILKQTLGKYWEVKEYNNENKEILYNTRLIYPYQIISVNNTFWYIEGIVDDDYNSGMRSCTGDCNDGFNNCLFTEITKEEFNKRVKDHIESVLDIRLKKMETRNEPMIK